ncbi:MAG: lactonase family protein [Terriglobia bacterium]
MTRSGYATGRRRRQDGVLLAYVGAFSSPKGPEGSIGRGEGIYLFEVDASTGALSHREVFKDAANPSCLALDPSGTHLYSADEISGFEGTPAGSVSAFSVDRASGRLSLLNTVSSEGAGPTYISIHPSGRYLFVANYAGGSVAVLPIRAGGGLGRASDVHHDTGSAGPPRAASAPRGSFAISGHDAPHAHCILPDPSGQFVLSTDLGMDRIFVWEFDAQAGRLSPASPAYVSLPPGDGPRHLAFHPNGRWLYSIQEEGSTLVLFHYDERTGKLAAKQTISTLPEEFAGTNFTSEVSVSPDGKFVYAANRLHDSISCFSVGPGGRLSFSSDTWTRGDYPRSFAIHPAGGFLYSCNQRADAITIFRIYRPTGGLAFTGQYVPVGTPSMMVFLSV